MANQLEEIKVKIHEQLGKVVIGQPKVIDGIIIALLSRGHVLLEGVPGTAKTLIAKTIARCLELDFKRIQFTPDLMPADIIGTNVFDLKRGEFKLCKGPIFTDILLGDEINRAPPKTQSALLESMQERQVSIDIESYPLGEFFIVIATQNPVEQEGTYPLPEAQLDRFLLKITVDYPNEEEERQILKKSEAILSYGNLDSLGIETVLTKQELKNLRQIGDTVIVKDEVIEYMVKLIRLTRNWPRLIYGAGPRAGVHLLTACRWNALLQGREFITPQDVKEMLIPVLAHRIVVAPETEIEGMKADSILMEISEQVEVPR